MQQDRFGRDLADEDIDSVPIFEDETGGVAPCNLTPHEIGVLGEKIARLYLEERGYRILHTNYRCPEGEADLVAFDEDASAVVLVEVKTRRASGASEGVFPEEAVGARKRHRYHRIAACYARAHGPVREIRFDVIAITITSDTTASLEHLIGAFDWEADE